jgi:cytochrome c-type biogenesis protein CcmF
MISSADRRFANPSPRLLGLLVSALAARYQFSPPPASFRMIVSPLVEWIWIGGMIGVLGALIAIWPPGGLAASRLRFGLPIRPRRALPES